MDRWRGKVAVVTGASSGIGTSIVEKLVAAGMQVVGFARRVERIEELAKKLNGKHSGTLHAMKVDMTKESDITCAIKATITKFGPVHILVNNAGVMENTHLIGGDTEKWRRTFETNVIGLCIANREVIACMQANKIDGHIVNINSVAGHKVIYVPGNNVYGASKCAVTNLTEMLRLELVHSKSKIKVTSVSPGGVDTQMFEGMVTVAKVPSKEDLPKLKPEDIADAVLYTLGTPPHVQVHEMTVKPVGEIY